ncbi:MAG: sulfatase [Bryobacteraceae bacterium]
MNRRAFLTAAAGTALPGLRAAEARPNILIVMTDQQFAEAMSCRIGRQYLHTPNMDSLAANGTFFSRAYCANPLCVPSRTSMFTGRYPSETGVQTNNTTPIDARRFPLMGSIFKQAGYTTAYFGKWHLPYPERQPAIHGFDHLGRTKREGDPGIARNAVEFLSSRPRQPFLAVASFVNPHNICQWARGEELPDGPIGAPPPPEQCPPARPNLELQKDAPDVIALMRRSYQGHPKFPVGNFDERKWRQYIWAYYRMIEKVDGLIGQVLAPLRQARLEERTLIVFLADHGDCQGAHRWNQKTVFFEEAARVPLIVSYKGVTKPGVSRRLAHTGVDLIPTLCSYAGIPKPAQLPGLSLRDPDKDPREYLVVCNKMIEGAEVDGRLPTPEGRMVRSQRYKYCAYSEGARRESLVDLERDPGEMVNVAGEARYRETLVRHRAMLAAWGRQTNDRFAIPG